MIKHIHRKAPRTEEEAIKLRTDRQRYLVEKPGPERLLAEGGHDDFIPLGELILLHKMIAHLKKERIHQGITLAALSARTQIDEATLSRLEAGKNANPTLHTLFRIALALGKVISCSLQDAPPRTTRSASTPNRRASSPRRKSAKSHSS
jgi:DNA-binding Xre family transcriptional regulator